MSRWQEGRRKVEKVKRGKERGGEEMRAEEKWTKREGCEGYRE